MDFVLHPGINIGVCLRYSIYSSPKRLISSGSSIFFSSHTLIRTYNGVKKNTSETELTPNPMPNKIRKTPVSIGFLTYR